MMADFSLDDIDSMINDASQGYDFSNYFSGDSGANVDLGQPDSRQFSLGDIDQMLARTDFGSNFDLGSREDIAAADALSGIDTSSFKGPMGPLDEATTGRFADEFARYLDTTQADYKAPDMGNLPAQDFGGADVTKYMDEYQSNLQDIMDKGGYTSQWQTVGSDRVMVADDGTGIGINTETGESYSLNKDQVDKMVNQGLLNTYASGYNTATGGSKLAPGGGKFVTLKDGTTGVLLPGGKIINVDTGKVIGITDDGKTVTKVNDTKKVDDTKRVDTTKTTTPGGTKPGQQNMNSLLPLLLALLAMGKGGGGGKSGASSAVIPALTASQKQTPYAAIQQAAGYRPGQGGITYFNPVQYAPRMAAGGIAELSRGRLLDGPGDGVSDSIPAQIGGMAGGGQPARLARGEYVIDARTVAALGNGSTDAGAERLDQMRKKILSDDRKAKVGQDSKAYRHLKA